MPAPHPKSPELHIVTPFDYKYEGSELTLFAAATNWKNYWTRQVRPYIGGDTLEVGAGLGTNTALLADRATGWTCLEPDQQLADEIRRSIGAGRLPPHCRVVTGTLSALEPEILVDSILYIDVMEHIAEDRQEMAKAAEKLRPGGHHIVLAPALQWLFSPFDAAIGHHRRYSKKSLLALAPHTLEPVRAWLSRFLRLVGLGGKPLAAVDCHAEPGQIRFWDGVLVRLSRAADPVLGFGVGKTVSGIWKRK